MNKNDRPAVREGLPNMLTDVLTGVLTGVCTRVTRHRRNLLFGPPGKPKDPSDFTCEGISIPGVAVRTRGVKSNGCGGLT